MPARFFALWSWTLSLSSAVGGSLYLHLAHVGCNGGRRSPRTSPSAPVENHPAPMLVQQQRVDAYPTGDPVNCTELLRQYSIQERLQRRDESTSIDTQALLGPELDDIWTDLLSNARTNSFFLDAGTSASSLPMNFFADASAAYDVHLFQPQLSQQLETCKILSRRPQGATQSTFHIHPIAAGEREDILLPSRQRQTSFDTFANDRGWFGANDDRYQTMNGGSYLRGSTTKAAQVPLVQVLSISGTAATEISLILDGGIELLNRHFVRNVLVTLAIDDDRDEDGQRASLLEGMKVIEDAGYHVHKTVDWSSSANRQLVVWWKL